MAHSPRTGRTPESKRNDMKSIKEAISSGKNVLIVGATGEGKTTDLETIKAFSPSRIITVTDASPIQVVAGKGRTDGSDLLAHYRK